MPTPQGSGPVGAPAARPAGPLPGAESASGRRFRTRDLVIFGSVVGFVVVAVVVIVIVVLMTTG